MENTPQSFRKSMGLLDATMLVAGSMIGSGIFIVSADIVRNTGSAGWMMAVWIISGFMTLTAALSYGELSAMFPKAGGQYVYLREAYSPLVSFVFGWTFFAVIQTATIAAVGVAFAKFTAYLFPILDEDVYLFAVGNYSVSSAQLLAIGVIVLLTGINARGINSGKRVQTTLTLIKILSLLLLILCGFLAYKHAIWNANWSAAGDLWQLRRLHADGSFGEYSTFGAFGAVSAALVGALFSSDSWHSSSAVAGEIKNPQRNIGLSLALGTIIVTAIYLLTNLMYTAVLDLHQMATAPKDRVAMSAAQEIFGTFGIGIIAIMIMISTFGCNNGIILAGARVYYSMAQDGLFFKKVGTLNKSAVPAYALWLQCVVACLWCLSGKYGDLLDMITCVVVIFYVLAIVGVIRLRYTRPELPRPYKALGYPFLPVIYIVMGLAFIILMLIYKPYYTMPGVLIALAGVPIFYFVNKKNKQHV
ncbi:amino acid/polyamine/organocation transporter (APC superfamily) [Sphingobacterium allocomposti]|uniref:Amino acid/polyamine/organocation transporter (APC superfamily) n=1 Tax=Sphingobacterium allocomposti TaxID=415956 RepID=A0A5S5DKY0_9SPHI|nr:amino acid permease [Sphingobacterium composti Yoo et al. 2007 non Ten et al. 2007]TYP96355.1 amino acid/polyamine/organocation transporter (APC superfamily) [Sphingobacterium composti Yoo et al. 2007 non Ten et al. 2007]